MTRAREDLMVIAAQAGDTRAFEALFNHYNSPLRRFAYRLSGDRDLAMDAVQDAWITLSRTLRTLEDPRGFRVWAFRTVRWRVTDRARRRSKVTGSLDDVPEIAGISGEPDATSDQLTRHLAAMPAGDRQVLELFYLEELKLIEIAGVLEVPLGTIKSRLNRARNQLRQQMTEHDSKAMEAENVRFR